MRSKLFMTVLVSFLAVNTATAAELQISPPQEIIVPESNSTSYMIYLYSPVSFSSLISSLDSNQTLYIQYFLNDPALMEIKYSNVPFLITAVLSKAKGVQYYLYFKYGYLSDPFSSFDDLKNYVQGLINSGELQGKDPNFDLIKDYVDYYNGTLKAGGLYQIVSKGGDLILKPQLPSNTTTVNTTNSTTTTVVITNSTSTSSTNSTNSAIPYPPTPPDLSEGE